MWSTHQRPEENDWIQVRAKTSSSHIYQDFLKSQTTWNYCIIIIDLIYLYSESHIFLARICLGFFMINNRTHQPSGDQQPKPRKQAGVYHQCRMYRQHLRESWGLEQRHIYTHITQFKPSLGDGSELKWASGQWAECMWVGVPAGGTQGNHSNHSLQVPTGLWHIPECMHTCSKGWLQLRVNKKPSLCPGSIVSCISTEGSSLDYVLQKSGRRKKYIALSANSFFSLRNASLYKSLYLQQQVSESAEAL